MKKLSKFQLVLLSVFGALAISGVLIFALAVGGGNSSVLGPVTIWGTLDGRAFGAVLRAAADEEPNLNQVTYVQKDPDTYESDLTEALASGEGPDLFLLTQDYALKTKGQVALIPFSALPQSQFEGTFVDVASPFLSEVGVIGVPLIADPLVLYWNKDILSSAGYASPPQYWDQLFDIARSVSARNETGSIVQSALAFGEYKNIAHAKDILATLILQADGAITQYDNSGKLRSALVLKSGGSASQATASALRFYTEFADPSKDDYSWNRSLPEARQFFAAGDLALYVGYVSEREKIAQMNPNLSFGIAGLPQIRNASRTLDTSRVYALAAARAGKNPSTAVTVAYLLTSAANSQAFSTAFGLPSVRRDILGAAASGDVASRMVVTSHSWIDPDPAQTDDIFRAMIENTTSGAMLLTEAISRADQQLNHFLNQEQPQ
ncbi:MAG: extracellular solute-binding protein [Patescibacteria group bacterium]|nr:extracellular solute-binding protein [Patescibacteria group bacterium]